MKIYLLGISPRSVSPSPSFFMSSSSPLFSGSWEDPPPLRGSLGLSPSFPFILVFSPVLHIRVSFSLFEVVTRLINPHVRVVGEELDSMVRVWVCQAIGSTLR